VSDRKSAEHMARCQTMRGGVMESEAAIIADLVAAEERIKAVEAEWDKWVQTNHEWISERATVLFTMDAMRAGHKELSERCAAVEAEREQADKSAKAWLHLQRDTEDRANTAERELAEYKVKWDILAKRHNDISNERDRLLEQRDGLVKALRHVAAKGHYGAQTAGIIDKVLARYAVKGEGND
jgi:chromosome segregation ATPase